MAACCCLLLHELVLAGMDRDPIWWSRAAPQLVVPMSRKDGSQDVFENLALCVCLVDLWKRIVVSVSRIKAVSPFLLDCHVWQWLRDSGWGLSPACVFFPEPGLKWLQTQVVAQDYLIPRVFVKMLLHQQGWRCLWDSHIHLCEWPWLWWM